MTSGQPDITEAMVEEARAFNTYVEETYGSLPGIETVPAEVTRKARREPGGVFPPPVYLDDAEDISIEGPAGAIPVRLLRPDSEPTGLYIHIHGGGHTLGAHDMQDEALKTAARETGMVVASIGYRLAPENPYPAGPDDCEAAAVELVRNGPERLGAPRRIAIGGESAGSHLSILTLLRLRDKHGLADAVAGANLVYGGYDMTGTPSTRHWNRRLILTQENIHWFTENFLSQVPIEERRAPDISPLYADLKGLPSALFTIGSADPLLDDSLFMAARWEAAGNQAQLAVYPEGCHAFNAFPIALGRAANQRQYQFLRSLVGVAQATPVTA